ncbi:MAG: glutaminyl-peptide cyclotransferase [Candidatus Vecturithrix sp.]|nr:glutaminyl-peptide cyclotransferase [Candidatus Vecturithrix sp.]
MKKRVVFLVIYIFFLGAFQSEGAAAVKRYTVQILNTLPHNTASFTQGLVYHEGVLYESTGLYGQSTLQKLEAATGKLLKKISVPEVFAEGLARWQDRLIQITWKNRTALIYTLADFSPLGMFQYDTEGWGLTNDDQWLIMSDGTNVLTFRNPDTFAVERRIEVTVQGEPVPYLNELEYIDGLIYANVWYQNFIVQIDPVDGEVVGVIDAAPLFHQLPPLSDDSVLNGIAYNHHRHTLYLTGKNWPKIFEVTLRPIP